MKTTAKKSITALLFVVPMTMNAQLLKGTLVGADSIPEDAIGSYTPDGNFYNTNMKDLKFSPDGTFTYDIELADNEGDVSLELDGIGYFGAHLVKGKTVEMTIARKGDGWEATFKGEQPDVNRFVNRYTQAFDMMRYWSPDPSEAKPIAEYRQMLDNEYKDVVKLLAKIKDKQQKEYYTKLTESQYSWMKIRLIMDSCENDNSNYRKNAEFKELVKNIDINDPINIRTNMAYTALSSDVEAELGGDNGDYCEQMMARTDEHVTNPALRTFLVQMIGQNYFTYGNGEGDYQRFIDKYVKWAGKDADIAQALADQFLAKKKSMENTQAGKPAPDVTLTTPDGQKVQLSSLLGGKFTYIDVWATWCGPCVKEIPHLEKLVERFKENPNVQFISISIDANEAAWHKKIEKDNPQWAQYIINGEVEAQFSKDWGISGIPRFIMINKDGTIFSGDATRPSQEETATTIEEQSK